MFAVIKTGGKQYRVAKDDVIKVEKLEGEAGSEIVLDHVLLVGDADSQTVGAPVVEGAAVKAEVISQKKDDKVIVFKKKRRHNYRRKKGHRQEITVLKVTDIVASGAKKASAPKAATKKSTAKKAAKKTAAKKAAAKKD
ncbi:50S ribosomal protein L21 [Rhodospirillaceae bacterium RKSG073]|nr:50S ribosomal protein L21 [Curvivirga aplysinae]